MIEDNAAKKNSDNLKNLFYRKYKENTSYTISRYALMLSDCIIFIIALFLSKKFIIPSIIVFYQMGKPTIDKNVIVAIDWHYLLMIACVFYFRVTGHYNRRQTIWEYTPKVFWAILFSAIFDFFMLSISSLAIKPFNEIRIIFLLALIKWIGLFLLLIITRERTKKILTILGFWQKPTVIIGVGDNAKQTYLALSREKSLGLDVKLFIDTNKKNEDSYPEVKEFNIPIITLNEKPKDFFKNLNWPHVIIALEEKELKKASNIIDTLTLRPNSLDIIPPVRGFALYGLDVAHIFGSEILLLRARNNLARFFPRVFKRFFDIIVTSLFLILACPFLITFVAIISYLIKKDGGSVFYNSPRIGYKGRTFPCYKFRTMVLNGDKILSDLLAKDTEAKEHWEKYFKLKNDPRVTNIGKFLRKTSLDELPQLFNVLKGDMSLVGPRPILPNEVNSYGDYLGYYQEVKPGITGLWQISGRNQVDFAYRIRLDVWYIKNWSFWYDIVILLKTIPVVFKRQGAY